MAARGVSSARAAQYAVLETRQAKDYDVEPSAAAQTDGPNKPPRLGWDPDQLDERAGTGLSRRPDRRTGRQDPRPAARARRADQAGQHVRSARRAAGLVRPTPRRRRHQPDRDSSPTRPSPTRGSCRSHRSTTDPVGTMRHQTTRTADRHTLDRHRATRPRSCSRSKPASSTAPSPAPTTGLGVADEDCVLAALAARPSLSDEQVEMVAALTTSGRAGRRRDRRGRDRQDVQPRRRPRRLATLRPSRHRHRARGRAAAELEATAGIPSHTIASLLTDLDHPDHGRLRAGTVLVVDEAGMVGTRLLARILDHAAAARREGRARRRSPPTPRDRRRRAPPRPRPTHPAHPPHREPPPTRSLGTPRPRPTPRRQRRRRRSPAYDDHGRIRTHRHRARERATR